jgi:hypothetical protein
METSWSKVSYIFTISRHLVSAHQHSRYADCLQLTLRLPRTNFYKHIQLFEHVCGKNAWGNAVLVTNKWSSSYGENQKQLDREKLLISDPWKNMIQMGSQVMQHNGTLQSARRILAILYGKPKISLPNTISFEATLLKDDAIEGSEEDDKAQPSMPKLPEKENT